ncbi:Translation machinery-associated protein 10 [Wickerhamomyces ciferrii]|uniref:Translation machinery-associated protein 10 n=1 Tax=Wickerhamomyces ciferrii (strain ATCC 14091 / BCRC 22168 / CBS 111 / JCM 3599 / NBRC 0793 / NRRL Y-1031 F-60-10) TaxID=1206466 RepID=K0KH18_WICCF|nr:Translation machinery-associated protein 10 [Wickerhamomyces ciferrii]CCH44505.1 Translation machinery-associated protein 10 [Wickerhamomyces ciferrii]
MTRTQKWTHHEKKAEPHMFTHNGHPDQNPTKTKKNGAGKGNWGSPGDEINDLIDDGEIPPVFNKTRRGSNSSAHELKFDAVQHFHDHIDEDDEEEYEDDYESNESDESK